MEIFDDSIFKAVRDDDLPRPTVIDNSILDNLGRSRAKKRLSIKKDDTGPLELPPYKPHFIPTEVQLALYQASVIGRNEAEEFIKKSGIKKCTTSVLSSGKFESPSSLSSVPKKRTKACSELDTPNEVSLTPETNVNQGTTKRSEVPFLLHINSIINDKEVGSLQSPKRNKSSRKRKSPVSRIRKLMESRSNTAASPELDNVTFTQSKSSIILKGLVAFVDLGTDSENRSKDVKEMLLSLGAEVKNYFTKKVLIVIFEDGLMSTYTRAKLRKVPLVSKLWIEACREKQEIVPIDLHPPLGLKEYQTALTCDLFKY